MPINLMTTYVSVADGVEEATPLVLGVSDAVATPGYSEHQRCENGGPSKGREPDIEGPLPADPEREQQKAAIGMAASVEEENIISQCAVDHDGNVRGPTRGEGNVYARILTT